MPTMPARRRRPLLALAVAAVLGVGLTGPLVTDAAAAPTAPATIVVEDVYGGTEAPPATPDAAIPEAVIKAGEVFTVEVSFLDASGQPATFSSDARLALSSSKGTLTVVNGVAAAGDPLVELTAKIAAPVNQVAVTVDGAGSLARKLAEDSTPLFDVLKDVQTKLSAANVAVQKGIGGLNDCTEATKADPICAIVLLGNGARSSYFVVSQGACDGAGGSYAPCDTRGSVVQLLANLGDQATNDALYTPSAPATMIFKCDKTLCGTGTVQSKKIFYTPSGTANVDQEAGACPAKNTLGSAPLCIDYVQTKRDGSGDTLFFLLFTKDLRVRGT